MEAMSTLGETYTPQPALAGWHERRFKAFEALQGVGRDIR
jgi:D-ribulokinase